MFDNWEIAVVATFLLWASHTIGYRSGIKAGTLIGIENALQWLHDNDYLDKDKVDWDDLT